MAATNSLPVIHVLFENPDWNPPLIAALEAEGFPYRLVELDDGLLDPSQEPAEGIWWNRVSPSSHTREHHGTVPLAREFLYWLEQAGRRVINGTRAFELEMSKFRQDLVLRRYGIRTPRTLLAVGREALLKAAATFEGPFLTKHNQGGKGLGIYRMDSVDDLARHLDDPAFDPGPDGKLILQELIEAPEPHITRVEIAGGRLILAMHSSTVGGFELCPSDACQLTADVCPADGGAKFRPAALSEDDPLVQAYVALLEGEDIHLAGIEYIEDRDGNRYTYDINGTTNYSGVLGEEIGIDGMREVVRDLRLALEAEQALHAAK
jgi:hypothetical protein